MKAKIRTYVYTNFRGLVVPEDGVECKYFIVISIVSLLVYNYKYGVECKYFIVISIVSLLVYNYKYYSQIFRQLCL